MRLFVKTVFAVSIIGLFSTSFANTDSRPNGKSSVYQNDSTQISYHMPSRDMMSEKNTAIHQGKINNLLQKNHSYIN